MEIGYLQRPDALRLFAWHGVDNYGDRLGPALFHLVTKRPVYIEARGLQLIFDQGEPRTIHCFLGTLAHLLSGPHRFVLWGFGVAPPSGPAHHGCRPLARDLDIDVRALRGPLTRDVFVASGYDIPETVPYGDPGLLVPGFFAASPHRVDDFCVIPHHAHYSEWRDKLRGMNVIDLNLATYEGLQGLILEITKYRAVFSSSLHATILAESFGIPTRPIAPTLPFKFDDFYASVGKEVEYIPEMTPDLDWAGLYEETIREWRPALWNPEPWLENSPFPIDDSLRRKLNDHYAQLSETKPPAPGPASLPERTLASYRLIAANRVKAGPQSTPPNNKQSKPIQLSETRMLGEDFRTAPEKWCLTIGGRNLHFLGDREPAKIVGEGCELTARSGGIHLSTDFVPALKALEVRASAEFSVVEGLAELSLQDEQFRTVAQATVLPGGGGTQEMTFWPVSPNSCVRVVVSPLRGRLVIRKISIVGLSQSTPDASSAADSQS
jgi:pyruvyltransferase